MSDEGYYELAKAIILQAVKDFKPAYLRLKRRPDDKAAQCGWSGASAEDHETD